MENHGREREKWDAFYSTLPVTGVDDITHRFNQEFLASVNQLLPDGGAVLEAGCGGGFQSLALGQTGRYDVALMDFSPKALEYARSLFGREQQQASFHEGDVFALGQPEYDLVFNAGSLEHYSLEDQVAFLKGMASRSRRYVLALVPNRLCYWYWLWRIEKTASGEWSFGTELPEASLSEVFQRSGLHFVGHQFMGSNWAEHFIHDLPGLSDQLKQELIIIHQSELPIPPAQKSYLLAALGSVTPIETDADILALWDNESTQDSQLPGLQAALADSLALTIASNRQIQLLEAKAVAHQQEKDALRAEHQQEKDALRAEHQQEKDALRAEHQQERDARRAEHQQEKADLTKMLQDYQRTLEGVHASRAWRAAEIYRRVRARFFEGPRSSVRTLRRLVVNLVRKLYRSSVPPKIRDIIYRKRHRNLHPSQPQNPEVSQTITPVASGTSEFPSTLDVIIFPVIPWDFRFQRPQQIATQFASHGHRVFYFHPTFSGLQQQTIQKRTISEHIFELLLPGQADLNLYKQPLGEPTFSIVAKALQEFFDREHIREAVCLVQYPFWEPLANVFKQKYGWKIVYDCMDDHEGFAGTTLPIGLLEQRLIESADLVVVSSRVLETKFAQLHPNVALIHNAVDYRHFCNLPEPGVSPIAEFAHPIIGYYGAIAEWFDVGALSLAANRHPEWTFVLIGHVMGVDLKDLPELPNVHLLGEKDYSQLPTYLVMFDVCVIPFLRTALTEATNPVKVYEYLATGKPVVARDLPELQPYDDVVEQYVTPEEFILKLEQTLTQKDNALFNKRQAIAKDNTWTARYLALQERLTALYGKVSIIIVTYQNLEYTRLCLNSILSKTAYPDYEIIVVDNGSGEALTSYLTQTAREESRLKVILNHKNLGFAAANNIGLQAATGEYLVLLNDDTAVTYSWLGSLVHHLQDPEIGLVGPVTNFIGNEACIPVSYTNLAEIDSFAYEYTSKHQGQRYDIDVLAMYCLAMRRQVYEEIGPIDERFGIGMFEDDDYAMRARALGYRVICVEDVFIHHFGSASFKKLSKKEYAKLFALNRAKFEEKWGVMWRVHKARETSTAQQSKSLQKEIISVDSLEYEEHVRAEIEAYSRDDSEHFWDENLLQTVPPSWIKVEEVGDQRVLRATGVKNNREYVVRTANNRPYTRILSLGSGPCGFEITMAEQISQPYEIVCVDINPHLLEMGSSVARQKRLNLVTHELDINKARLEREAFDIVFVHAALHHFIEFEHIFEQISNTLRPDGELVVVDVIGRNGFLMWPNTAYMVDLIWKILPNQYKYNHTSFGKVVHTPEHYFERSTAESGFECIRTEDLLPLLADYFQPMHYLPMFSIMRRFFDTMYGPNYTFGQSLDQVIFDFIRDVDETSLDSEILLPETFFGVFRRGDAGENAHSQALKALMRRNARERGNITKSQVRQLFETHVTKHNLPFARKV